jgi:hypothetical protein
LEVRDQARAIAHARRFVLRRGLDFHDEIGAPNRLGVDQRGPRLSERVVHEAGGRARTLLDHHLRARLHEARHGVGNRGDAAFVRREFTRHTDLHSTLLGRLAAVGGKPSPGLERAGRRGTVGY